MSLPRPGDYITARCGRCDDITGHVVMIVLDTGIERVECKACGSVHKYRDSKQKKAAVSKSSAVRHVPAGKTREEARVLGSETRATKTAAPRPRGARAAAAKLESAWQEAMVRHSGETPVPYSMSASFELQSLVEHSVFGLGEVIEITRPDKVTILFQEGMKVLRCKVE